MISFYLCNLIDLQRHEASAFASPQWQKPKHISNAHRGEAKAEAKYKLMIRV